MLVITILILLSTSYLSFAHDSSVQSTIKRWNKLTNPNGHNERKPSDIHILKKYYDSLLTQNTNPIKNVITIPHSDSMTIATLYEQLLRTKISGSVLTSQQRNEVINNTLNIVLELGLPDDIINPDWVQLVGDKNKHISLDYYYDANCHEVNKQYYGKFGKISFMYSVLEKNVHIVTDESNIETVLKRWNKSTNPYWCNDRKQNDADIVKKYYDCVISHNSNESVSNLSHHDSIEIYNLYEHLLSQKTDASLLSPIHRKDLLQNTSHIISHLGLPDDINDVHMVRLNDNKEKMDLISISYYFDGYCDEEKRKYKGHYGKISFLYSRTNRKVVSILLLAID